MLIPIPALNDMNVYDSLDERVAVEHFLDKDLKQAEDLFRRNFLYYQEDLMWMGPLAFCYYVQAAIAYLDSPDAKGNADAASSFCAVVAFQLENHGASIQPVKAILGDAIRRILARFSEFDCDPAIYGDLAPRYRALQEQLTA